ncbi:AraC family transcriptional regulator [Cesiribacter sp. SM1]|uniref:helix-turn-helix domain-containing protein n=1 Tax=Cesiribacter sp. SM1 TaxID=2861196 RepID=UPI001CD59C9E|nr:AraC family transcriptional regulator [Cesiribacter sp. SM1]
MRQIFSESGELLFSLKNSLSTSSDSLEQYVGYTVYFVPQGRGIYHADVGAFPFEGPVLLFSTPMQQIKFETKKAIRFIRLLFHNDFYCIDFHQTEVACNGILFNNVNIDPSVVINAAERKEFIQIFNNIKEELEKTSVSQLVLKAYLLLLLAKAGSIKTHSMAKVHKHADELMERFRQLLNENYLKLHKPSDYAMLLNTPSNTFTKRSRKYFGKTPSQLIQERLIQEAKTLLLMTNQSIKEIGYSLNFKDEFYFSRVFKKITGVSPFAFREQKSVSVVEDLTS